MLHPEGSRERTASKLRASDGSILRSRPSFVTPSLARGRSWPRDLHLKRIIVEQANMPQRSRLLRLRASWYCRRQLLCSRPSRDLRAAIRQRPNGAASRYMEHRRLGAVSGRPGRPRSEPSPVTQLVQEGFVNHGMVPTAEGSKKAAHWKGVPPLRHQGTSYVVDEFGPFLAVQRRRTSKLLLKCLTIRSSASISTLAAQFRQKPFVIVKRDNEDRLTVVGQLSLNVYRGRR